MEFEEEYCCILRICCGAGKHKAKKALAQKLEADVNVPEHLAKQVADWLLDHFDLAPEGTGYPLIKAVAEMARAYPYNAD